MVYETDVGLEIAHGDQLFICGIDGSVISRSYQCILNVCDQFNRTRLSDHGVDVKYENLHERDGQIQAIEFGDNSSIAVFSCIDNQDMLIGENRLYCDKKRWSSMFAIIIYLSTFLLSSFALCTLLLFAYSLYC